MCGIAGIIQSSPKHDRSDVKKMTDALAHRGPDGEGYWQNENSTALFGHRRLCIIDLSEAAAQPLHYLNRYTIIHNGEVYNYIELREELIKKGYSFRSQTDTEVIVACYDLWKENCLARFDGMFAFAIWDEKEKTFFAARDRFGEKPFFYTHNEEEKAFWFASEMKAFWAAGLEKSPNLKMLFNFLTIGYVDNPNDTAETFDNNIDKLPPAHFLKIDVQNNFTVEIEKYWDIDPEKQSKIADDEAIEKFDDLFQTSVKRRLRSDVPLGTSLSGGIDSSSVIATMQAFLPGIKTFSAIFPGFEKDEEKYIDIVSKQFSLQSFKTNVDESELASLIQTLIKQQDEPFGSAGTIPQFKVFELARTNHVKVLLDGQGADEILAGYHKYYKWYWQELFRKQRLITSGELRAAKKIGVKEKFGPKNIIAALFPDFASVILEKQYLLNALNQDDLTKDFVKYQSKEAYYATPTIFSLNGALYFNTMMHGLEELLRYADRNSMAHGREVRLPFLSHELVEFIFSLPSNFKIREGWTKWILRKAMDKKIDAQIIWRSNKIGFEPPQKQWMQSKSVREMIVESKNKLVRENILKPSVLKKEITAAAAYEKNNTDWKYLVAGAYI